MHVHFYETADDTLLKFAVIVSKSNGKWVFCKHKERDTYEETGAIVFDIKPVCVYSVTGKTRVNETGEESFGMLYYAEISAFEKELHSEMEQVLLLDELPGKWTYPQIQPLLIAEVQRRL